MHPNTKLSLTITLNLLPSDTKIMFSKCWYFLADVIIFLLKTYRTLFSKAMPTKYLIYKMEYPEEVIVKGADPLLASAKAIKNWT